MEKVFDTMKIKIDNLIPKQNNIKQSKLYVILRLKHTWTPYTRIAIKIIEKSVKKYHLICKRFT